MVYSMHCQLLWELWWLLCFSKTPPLLVLPVLYMDYWEHCFRNLFGTGNFIPIRPVFFPFVVFSHCSATNKFYWLDADFSNSNISLCLCVQLRPWFSTLYRQFCQHRRFYIRIPSWICFSTQPSAPTSSSK